MNQKYSLQNVKPVLSMYAVTLLLVIVKQLIMPEFHHGHGQWSWHVLMMDFMGMMFLISAALKLMRLQCFVDAYVKYDLITQRVLWYGYAYPFIEVALGIAYLTYWHLALIIWVTLVLELVNTIGVAWALYNEQEAECGCMGTAVKMPLTIVTLLENIFMLLMAVMMLWM